ncbi:hypothetical protein ACFLY0_00665 [Patescibacteria group bacterium]
MQNYKKIDLVLFFISICIIIPAIVFDPVVDYFCPTYDQGGRECINFASNIIEPVFWSFLALLPVTIALFFLRREVFVAWVKFAAIGFPIMLAGLLYTFNMPQSTGSFMGGPSESEIASVVLPGLFLIISLLIIAIKSWKLRKMNGAE